MDEFLQKHQVWPSPDPDVTVDVGQAPPVNAESVEAEPVAAPAEHALLEVVGSLTDTNVGLTQSGSMSHQSSAIGQAPPVELVDAEPVAAEIGRASDQEDNKQSAVEAFEQEISEAVTDIYRKEIRRVRHHA